MISIVFSSIISLYLCGFICKRWVWEIGEKSGFKSWSSGFCDSLARSNPRKESCVEHMIRKWRVVLGYLFCNCFAGKANLRKSLFGKRLCFALPSLYPHYIYPHYPQIVSSAFYRENPIKHTWELEIVIPTIIYTFPCVFLNSYISISRSLRGW